MVAGGEVTPDELLDIALEQVADLNPRLNAVVHLREGVARAAMDGFLTRSLRDTAALLDAVRGADVGAPYQLNTGRQRSLPPGIHPVI